MAVTKVMPRVDSFIFHHATFKTGIQWQNPDWLGYQWISIRRRVAILSPDISGSPRLLSLGPQLEVELPDVSGGSERCERYLPTWLVPR